MENKNPQTSVNTLIKTLNVLLGISIVMLIISTIVSFVQGNDWLGIGLLLGTIISGSICGFVISALRDAFESIIDILNVPTNGEEINENIASSLTADPVKEDIKESISSSPAPDIAMEDFEKFCADVESALQDSSQEQQADWMKQWRSKLNGLYENALDDAIKQVYQEEIDYITISLAALEQ